jgi:hypothetical protein
MEYSSGKRGNQKRRGKVVCNTVFASPEAPVDRAVIW